MSALKTVIEENNIVLTPYTDELAGLLKLSNHPGCGYAFNLEGKNYILYDADAPQSEKQYIIAHELGHILFGHLRGKITQDKETEANIFASVWTALELYREVCAR